MILRRRSTIISEDELKSYLSHGQTERVAFLSAKATARNIAETLTALANASGGVILVGVTKRGVPQKGLDLNRLREMVVEAGLLTEPPLILPTPQVLPVESSDSAQPSIVVAVVPPGLPHIYSLQGSYLTRTNTQNRPLTTPELRRLLLERGDAGFENLAMAGATLADLDQQRIERYFDHISLAPDEESIAVLLAKGCVTTVEPSTENISQQYSQKGEPPQSEQPIAPTHAGILLFSHAPQRFLRSAELLCVRYPGLSMGDEFERQDIHGTLIDQIRQAETFVITNMRRGMRIAGMAREETTEYPLPVVREAIVNAIAHRDYSIRGEGIRLLMFSDRLEIYSPGRLPGHVTLDNLKDERYSRNEAIVAVLSDLGYIERLGYGIDRMINTMQGAGLPEPIFEETAAGFKVTLKSADVELVSKEPEQQQWHHRLLNPRQEKAMAFVQEEGRITNSDYLTLVPGVSPETIRRDLADLVDKNLLLRIGSKRATYYILK